MKWPNVIVRFFLRHGRWPTVSEMAHGQRREARWFLNYSWSRGALG